MLLSYLQYSTLSFKQNIVYIHTRHIRACTLLHLNLIEIYSLLTENQIFVRLQSYQLQSITNNTIKTFRKYTILQYKDVSSFIIEQKTRSSLVKHVQSMKTSKWKNHKSKQHWSMKQATMKHKTCIRLKSQCGHIDTTTTESLGRTYCIPPQLVQTNVQKFVHTYCGPFKKIKENN